MQISDLSGFDLGLNLPPLSRRPTVVGNEELTAQHAIVASQLPHLAPGAPGPSGGPSGVPSSPALEQNDLADVLEGVPDGAADVMDEDL